VEEKRSRRKLDQGEREGNGVKGSDEDQEENMELEEKEDEEIVYFGFEAIPALQLTTLSVTQST
jgi:hypothetical protein